MDLELQKTLFNLFKKTLKFPFYDGLSNEGFPYGCFGYTRDNFLNTKTSRGNRLFYQIDLFSSYNGQKEIKQMTNDVLQVIESTFTLDNGKRVHLSDYNKMIRQEDEIYHGILEFTFEIY